MAGNLQGRRVLVVGASSGIGKAIAQRAVREGAQVVLSARRVEKLEAAVAEAGGGTIVAGDVRDPGACRTIVEEAVAVLGGLDLLVYASGIMSLVLMENMTLDRWRDAFETNAVGAFSVITTAISELDPDGLISVISSDSVGAPYNGLVSYSASKAALDEGIRGLRLEYPNVRFCRIAVGPTLGTDIAHDLDAAQAESLLPELLRNARVFERQMEAEDLGTMIADVLGTALVHPGVEMEDVMLKAPGGPVAWGTDLGAAAEVTAAFTD